MTAQTVYDAIRNTASDYPERAVLHTVAETAETYGIRAGDITYSQFIERADQIANELKRMGMTHKCAWPFCWKIDPIFSSSLQRLNKIGAPLSHKP